jgi:EAL domain-containing protein (putative c-di-GMP-specific phosphodiesterase class I)
VRKALRPKPFSPSADEPIMHPTELYAALSGAMIDTRYQPIVRMSDRKPVALEVLARLNHPSRGTLMPDYFVPQIEDAGLAAQLTDRVASRAFADMDGPVGKLGLRLTLNFPLDVMLVPAALARLEARRQEAGIAANRVAIELTESRPVDDMVALGAAVAHLRAGGYRVSIDDVSPAVPRLQDLLTLPFTSVKLDKQVVQGASARECARFVESVVQTARRRAMEVIAEGVEDIATWNRIETLGAGYAQGFLVARPLAASAVPVWFEAWTNRSALTANGHEP